MPTVDGTLTGGGDSLTARFKILDDRGHFIRYTYNARVNAALDEWQGSSVTLTYESKAKLVGQQDVVRPSVIGESIVDIFLENGSKIHADLTKRLENSSQVVGNGSWGVGEPEDEE